MVKQGTMLRILSLDSLQQLNKLVPENFLQIRNLFQLLLVDSFSVLVFSVEDVLEKETQLGEDVVDSLRRAIKPIERVCLELRYVKECLKDTHLVGSVRNTVKVTQNSRTIVLDENYPDKVGQGWFRVETNTDDFKL